MGKLRDKWKKRRADRKAARTAKPQYYGGTKENEDAYRAKSDDAVDAAGSERSEANKDLESTQKLTRYREQDADSDYRQAKGESDRTREDQRLSIGGIGTGATNAMAMRDQALAANNLNTIAEQNISANQANAQQQLGRGIGLMQRGAIGQAAAMGESGALGLQQALATSGQGAADMAAEAQLQQMQLAADTRNQAAQQQVANALGIADANAGLAYDQGLQTANATAGMRASDLAAQEAATGRQLNFLGQRAQLAGGAVDASLANQGQQLQNQQTINTSSLAAGAINDAARLKSNEENSLASRFGRVRQATSGGLLK